MPPTKARSWSLLRKHVGCLWHALFAGEISMPVLCTEFVESTTQRHAVCTVHLSFSFH